MSETRPARKPRLQERRQARMEASAARQREHVAQMHDQVKDPLDLLNVSYKLLRGRLVQFERKAVAARQRARTAEETTAAERRLAETHADIERICGEAAQAMARLTDEIHTERR